MVGGKGNMDKAQFWDDEIQEGEQGSILIPGDTPGFVKGDWSIYSNIDDGKDYFFVRHVCNTQFRYEKHYYARGRDTLVTCLMCPMCGRRCPKEVLTLWNLLK